MTTKEKVKNSVGVVGDMADLPLLGNIVWWSVRDFRISHEDLEKAFDKVGFDKAWMLKEPSRAHAFRAATGILKSSGVTENGHGFSIMVRDLGNDGESAIRKVIREERDTSNRVLEYQEVGELCFNVKSENMYSKLNPKYAGVAEYEAIMEKAKSEFDTLCSYHMGRKVRVMVHDLIMSLGPTVMRPSGAVYFVPRQHNEIVEKLEKLIPMIDKMAILHSDYDASVFESIAMMDSEKHRKSLYEKFKSQTAEELGAAAKELADLLKGEEKVTKSVAMKHINRVKELKAAVANYEELLSRDLNAAKSKMDLVNKQAVKLLDKIMTV
ncbi:MAG: hypothetical protein PHS46_08385 [Candidatus Omnitrophica bacterium]|nr:hypothetical protein [Candidatus Omnitrophota bacterium]